jgi:hypothetical protein
MQLAASAGQAGGGGAGGNSVFGPGAPMSVFSGTALNGAAAIGYGGGGGSIGVVGTAAGGAGGGGLVVITEYK